MKQRVTTENSVYIIDHDNQTWEKVESSARSGPLRTNGGSFITVEIVENGGMAIICPPLVDGTLGRVIYTSNVKKLEFLEQT
jgi:hypothetical protein